MKTIPIYPELKGKALLALSLFWSLWFINFTGRTIFSPLLPLIEDEFMIGHAMASSVFMFQSAGYGISQCFSSLFSGRFGYKRSILLSLLVSSLVFLLFAYTRLFSVFYIYSFIMGLSIGLYIPAAIPLITEYFSEKDWGKAIAIHDSAAPISIFVTPFIAILLLHFLTWRGACIVFAICFLISAFVVFLASEEVKIKDPMIISFKRVIRMPQLWLIGIIFTSASGANLGVYFICPLYMTKELHMDMAHANAILGISRLGSIGVAMLIGFIVDRMELKKTMRLLIFFTGILTILVALSPPRYVGIPLFFQAVIVSGVFPVGLVSIARLFGREIRGMATGFTMAISVGIGGGLIPYLLGLSGDLLSFRIGILVLGGLVTLSSWLTNLFKELK